MNDEVMKADNHEPDYRKAMLFHSDRADQYAAERDTVVAEAATLRAEVERLRGAVREAAEAWHAFKAANTTTDHFNAVERLDAILRALEEDGRDD